MMSIKLPKKLDETVESVAMLGVDLNYRASEGTPGFVSGITPPLPKHHYLSNRHGAFRIAAHC